MIEKADVTSLLTVAQSVPSASVDMAGRTA
jgi:hypothetical protein